MHDPRQEQRKYVAFWIAVGGTSAVVVALWAMILPTQLQRVRLEAQKDRSRWGVVDDGGGAKVKTFNELMAEQRTTLDEIEKRVSPSGTQEPASAASIGAAAKIEELKAKIQAASEKHSTEETPRNIPVEPPRP